MGRIPPPVWGPFFWHTIHLAALGYPNEPTFAEKKAAKEFYESFQHMIPCPVCKLHYQKNLKENPITPSLDSRKDLFRWTVNIHNIVNKELGKPQYTEEQSIAFYQQLGERGRSPVWTPQDLQADMFADVMKMIATAAAGIAVLGGAYVLYQKTLAK